MRNPIAPTKRVGLIALVTGAALLGVQVTAASAKTFTGVLTVKTNTVLFTHKIGTATEVLANARAVYKGAMNGRASETYITLTTADGKVVQYGYGTFWGTINGHKGSIDYNISGPSPAGGKCKWLDGTGGLANPKGGFRYHVIGQGPSFTFSGSLGFGT